MFGPRLETDPTTDQSASSWLVAVAVERHKQGPHRGGAEADGGPEFDVEGEGVGAGGHLGHPGGGAILRAVVDVATYEVDYRPPEGAGHLPAVDD